MPEPGLTLERALTALAERIDRSEPAWGGPLKLLYESGVLARALKVWPASDVDIHLDMPDMEFLAPQWESHRTPCG